MLSVGRTPDVLYKQGRCRVCGIPLYGPLPKRRYLCGEHQKESKHGKTT